MGKKEITPESRYKKYLKAELEAVGLYRLLAKGEKDANRAQVFEELAQSEIRHAAMWAEKLGISPRELEFPQPGWRIRLLGWMSRRFGFRLIAPLLMQEEFDNIRDYQSDPEGASLVGEERGHARAIGSLARGGGPRSILKRERWHYTGSSGTVRAAVLGVNDGLVSNFSLVMGVAGGTGEPRFVLLAGLAGLFAGAFSMAAGEYVSMRAQRDVYEHQIELERAEFEEAPEEEREELALIYQAKGMTKEEAQRLAERISGSKEVALDTLVREELGLDPSELGSPRKAALSSFVAFAGGAIVPVIPYLAPTGSLAFALSGVLSAGGLLAVGSLMAMVAGKSAIWGGLRMLLIGVAAASVTYGIGRLIGVSIAG